jgi:hypothetical protein
MSVAALAAIDPLHTDIVPARTDIAPRTTLIPPEDDLSYAADACPHGPIGSGRVRSAQNRRDRASFLGDAARPDVCSPIGPSLDKPAASRIHGHQRRPR